MVGVFYRAGSLITIGSSSSHVMPRMVVKVVPTNCQLLFKTHFAGPAPACQSYDRSVLDV